MQAVFDFYYEDDCPWYYFDNSYKTLLGACLFLFGVCGVLLNGWLFATFIHSHLLTFKSHLLVLNLCAASLARNLMGFPFSGSSALAKRWLFGNSCCHLFAFTNQFIGVFQMTALVVISVERYYQARQHKYEKELSILFFWLLVVLCWLSGVILATPPLFGYGAHTCDVTSTTCSYLWPSSPAGAKQIGFSVLLIIIGGFLPVFTILYFITKTVLLQRKFYRSENTKENQYLTRSLHTACITTLLLWAPAAILAGWQWLPQLIYGYRLHVPPALVLLAPVASEAATSVPVLCYLVGDERLRAALLGRMRKQYALLRPDRAKKYYRV